MSPQWSHMWGISSVRCMVADEMRREGWAQDQDGIWHYFPGLQKYSLQWSVCQRRVWEQSRDVDLVDVPHTRAGYSEEVFEELGFEHCPGVDEVSSWAFSVVVVSELASEVFGVNGV